MIESGDYIRKQISKDTAYAATYRQWFESLSPAERAKLKALDLDKPDVSYHGNGMSEKDMADSPLAREEAAVVEETEPDESTSQTGLVSHEAVWDAMRRMLGELLNQKNAKLTLECFALVSGASFLGDSMTEIARRHGVTRAAVSKRCIDITKQLNLPPSRAMRTEKARVSYRKAQIKIHQKKNQ